MRFGVDWLFGLLLAIAAGAGYTTEALILLGSLAAHEIAHLAVAWVLGLAVEELILTPLGGMARMDSTLETDPQAETSVALAGPFQSFFLAALSIVLAGIPFWDQRLVRFCFEVNASLAFFNLIPALPLDGGRALRGLLAQRWGYRRVTGWMVHLGRFCGIVLAGLAAGVLVKSGRFYPTPLIGGVFLAFSAGREAESAVFRSYRQFLHKRERLAQKRVIGAKQLVALAETRLSEVLEHMAARSYHVVLVVDGDLRPLGTLCEAELIDAFETLGPQTPVMQILDHKRT